jgi:hypothetical protein
MPFSYAELEQFYERLVTRARSRGIACAITSGMVCVAYGVISEAREAVAQIVHPAAMEWLPDVYEHFKFVEA